MEGALPVPVTKVPDGFAPAFPAFSPRSMRTSPSPEREEGHLPAPRLGAVELTWSSPAPRQLLAFYFAHLVAPFLASPPGSWVEIVRVAGEGLSPRCLGLGRGCCAVALVPLGTCWLQPRRCGGWGNAGTGKQSPLFCSGWGSHPQPRLT